ncbi:helix-turn-helix domain-containing protein [Nocardia sp. NBC_01503]|uniref:PucR family transcriptional regulator n=1 Tax=Nocardia sp. NBC_01503 TaxID=2975997 RepID=UPI002E7C214E|nr:helix-turn-helix domain-containing protein [Nocardia sp. NBC_01503]WTL30786.1 helix-turn-helix domain-containing protein [Nocardia sp. NBC_01503]
MPRTTPPEAIIEVADALLGRIDDLGLALAHRFQRELESYRNAAQVPFDSIRTSCTRNLTLMIRHFTSANPVDPEPPKETGRLRAQQGVPLAETLHAFRIGFEFLWSELVSEARGHPDVTDAMLVAVAAEVWALSGEYAVAVANAYREMSSELLLQREHERSVLVEALFTGVIADPSTLGETTRILGLPATGRYLVAAADVPAPGREALPGIESGLRALRITSAWRLLPDQQIGVLAVPTDREPAVLRTLRKHRTRVGISPPYESLPETPQALHFARLALTGLRGRATGVARFDDNPLAMLIAAAPVEAARMVHVQLGPILELPYEERNRLLETLRTWYAANGSAAETGRRLYLHPNTVRYRLRRIEELTARTLTDPAAVTELGTALQAHSLLD